MNEEIKALQERRDKLENTTGIIDTAKFAEEWKSLADDFDKVGMSVNAALCLSRWRNYAMMSNG